MSPDETVRNRPKAALCKATTVLGKRCKAIAGSDGRCSIHAGRQDPRELGRRGGSKARARDKGIDDSLAQDEELRKVARAVLLETMRDPDAKQSERLAAAKALYSYGPAKPPDGGASGAEVSGGYVPHDPVLILAMLSEVGLVAPALLGGQVQPQPPGGGRGEGFGGGT